MKAHILLVEDNPMNLALARFVLEQYGYNVTEAIDLQAARETLQCTEVDLVLLDIHLPDGSGTLFLSELREDERLKHLPVIAVTAFAMQGDQERLLALGFDGYISKPINVKTFAKEIATHLPSHHV